MKVLIIIMMMRLILLIIRIQMTGAEERLESEVILADSLHHLQELIKQTDTLHVIFLCFEVIR